MREIIEKMEALGHPIDFTRLIFLATKMLVLPLGDALPEMDTNRQYNHLHYGPRWDSQLTSKQLSNGLPFKYHPEPMILNSIAELNFIIWHFL